MRKINKSTTIPPTLTTAPTPTKKEEVDPKYYKAEDVRNQLIADQHHKCAYCECRIEKQYNDVEHYRPKSIYFKLGHQWDNLLYACNLCNRTYKNDNFPLADESKRMNLSQEDPLIINPSADDPLLHIKFNRFMVVPIQVNGIDDKKGKTTIEIFHLNDRNERPGLVYDREQLFERYEQEMKKKKLAESIISSGATGSSLTYAQELLNLSNNAILNYQSPSEPFSGMLIGQ